MKKLFTYLKDRFTEGGSYGSIAAVLVYFGLKPETSDIILDAVVALLGLIGLFVPERQKTEK